MSTPPKTHDEYLATVTDAQRVVLEALRAQIREIAPAATESISYQIAAFKQGRMLVGYGATPEHCAFFLMSNSTVDQFASELQGYDTSTGTIRFQPETPLPRELVEKLVQARLAENAAILADKAKANKSAAATEESEKPAAKSTAKTAANSSRGKGASKSPGLATSTRGVAAKKSPARGKSKPVSKSARAKPSVKVARSSKGTKALKTAKATKPVKAAKSKKATKTSVAVKKVKKRVLTKKGKK